MKEYQRETISKIVGQINKSIFLPDIQRPFVWQENQIITLFDSLMREYPISTFLFWRLTKEKLEAMETREKIRIKLFNFVDSNVKDNEECLSRDKDSYDFVLDGQQRLTSLYIALKGTWTQKVGKKLSQKELYFDVLSGVEEDADGILWQFSFMDKAKNLAFFEPNTETGPHLWVNVKRIYEEELAKTDQRTKFTQKVTDAASEGQDVKTVAMHKGKIQDSVSDLWNILRTDGTITYFPEDEDDYEKVLDIFIRTNSGGTKLGYSDLLFSMIKLKWPDAREKFKTLLADISIRNFTFDMDFILKTCLLVYAGKMDEVRYRTGNLSDSFITNMRNDWERISAAIKLTVGLLEGMLITDNKQLPSYNVLIPVIFWHFKTNHGVYRQDNDDYVELDKIRTLMVKASLSGTFGGQTDTVLYKCKTAIDESTATIFPADAIQSGLQSMRNRSINVSDETIDLMSYRSKASYLFLSLCYRMAINFKPILTGNLPEQDHIFSKDELTKAGVPPEKINSICNVRFVSQIDNRKKTNIPFTGWVNDLEMSMIKDKVFAMHLIPPGDWSVARFDEFLAARKQLLAAQLKS